MYLRFVDARTLTNSGVREGFFVAAYELRKRQSISAWELSEMETCLQWFRQNLPVPDRFNRTTSKGYCRRDAKGISWFKNDAKACLTMAYRMFTILNEHGYPVEMIKSDNVGYIIYEDEFQIVAEPFRDAPV